MAQDTALSNQLAVFNEMSVEGVSNQGLDASLTSSFIDENMKQERYKFSPSECC